MKTALISVSLADLRREPQDLELTAYEHNHLRETQLLYAEKVELIEEKDSWWKIAALEQERYRPNLGWHPYPGWVRRHELAFWEFPFPPNCVVCARWLSIPSKNLHLSYGTLLHRQTDGVLLTMDGPVTDYDPLSLRPLPTPLCRQTFLNDAKFFLEAPYLWGGRAMHGGDRVSSVDCSGLVNLLFRGLGHHVPRDAHDQFLRARPVEIEQLQPGDCVFLAPLDKPERVTHVVIYSGALNFLEAPETGQKVRQLSFNSSLGPVVELEKRAKPYKAYYGTFFNKAL